MLQYKSVTKIHFIATFCEAHCTQCTDLLGLSRLCRHFFENNRQALAFENNASILGGICSILGGKTISLSLIDSLLLICV